MSLEGKLLIAHPKVPKGTIFHRAVIYLYQDNPEQGSIGVIVNKPSKFRQLQARSSNFLIVSTCV